MRRNPSISGHANCSKIDRQKLENLMCDFRTFSQRKRDDVDETKMALTGRPGCGGRHGRLNTTRRSMLVK
jgi:hypothetical protein